MSVSPAPTTGRRLDVVANVLVALVVLYSVISTIVAISSSDSQAQQRAGSGGHFFGGLVIAVVLLAYLVVIKRAPSMLRWVFFGILTIVFVFAFGSILSGGAGTADNAKAPSAGGAIFAAAFICLPLVYMRLHKPKAAVKS
jgi:uncharacterized BrkB/YihY/UPF0761 family membrane protein